MTGFVLTQSKRNQLFKYDYYFTITFDKIENDKAFYLIEFGHGSDYFTFRNLEEVYKVSLRFSQLKESNILLWLFPPGAIINNLSAGFIENRTKYLNNWIKEVEDNNKSADLFKFLKTSFTNNIIVCNKV